MRALGVPRGDLGFEVTATTTVSAASGNRVAFKDFKVAGRVALPEAGEKLHGQVFAEPIASRNIPDGLRLLGQDHGAGPHRPLLRQVRHLPPRRRPGHLVERVGPREIRCRGPEEP
ncbi:hypothetical protein [Streptomyces luteogriseus]|uniref:hypothetical protein n=1 Tax=Streptomyces luteogriseus TaxID=68233 RepID=UPI00382524BE